MSVRASAEILSRIPVFSECERAHLQVLAFSARNHSFAPGEAVIKQGSPAMAAFLILDGIADISVAERRGLRKLGSAGPGVLLGELAMISGHNYSVTATARSLLTAAAIERETFLRVAGEFPEFGLRVHRAMARKLEAMVSELSVVKQVFDQARAFAR
ncbi:MAG: Crp/Fnr family transcriptional regulator [Rhizobiales bacterium]|nr:Crp/Fnr family transcriptional regulator [Hyphomicrobiales bacterium]